MLLFQISLIPLQQFYLTQAARSSALVYIQLKHYDGYKEDYDNILKEMLPGKYEEIPKAMFSGKFFDKPPKPNAAEVTKYLIRKELTDSANKNALPGKLFDVSKVTIKIDDTGNIQDKDNIFFLKKVLHKVGKAIANLFSTEEVTITVEYPFTLFKVFDLSFGVLPPITGKYTVRYNP